MNTAIEQMLKNYQIENIYDQKNAMKEIMQEIVLCGLSRAGFFQKAAFYGGTALRIFYGLDRFSEDLDFSLVTAAPDFDLTVYFPVLEKEVRAFGLHVTIQEKEKTKESNIRSAFLKGNTKEHLLLFYADENLAGSVARSEVVKIKFEVDINPPEDAFNWRVVEYETPEGYTVTVEREGITFVMTNSQIEEIPDEQTPEGGRPPGENTPPLENIPDEPIPMGPSLPQTGMLWWPVPVLACAGLFLFLMGWGKRRHEKE